MSMSSIPRPGADSQTPSDPDHDPSSAPEAPRSRTRPRREGAEELRARRRALLSRREPPVLRGRVSSLRASSGAVFADLHAEGELYQACALPGSGAFRELGGARLGDWLELRGSWGETRSGDRALFAQELLEIARCEAGFPPWQEPMGEASARSRPDWARASDPGRMRRIAGRMGAVEALRGWARERGLREALTPILCEEPSGAQAEPFWTDWRAGSRRLALRVAPESALIRLALSGLEGVYEIGPSFRNEGISARHHPEFLMMEAYRVGWGAQEAFGAAREALGAAWAALGGEDPGPCRSMRIREALGAFGCPAEGIDDRDWLARRLSEAGGGGEEELRSRGLAALRWEALDRLFEPPRGLVAVWGHPAELSPLAAPDPEREGESARFEIYLGGIEVANGYEQLRSETEQRARFREQARRAGAGREAMGQDARYLDAMGLGMPRISGFGLGIDRLCQLAFGCPIREALPFPLSGS